MSWPRQTATLKFDFKIRSTKLNQAWQLTKDALAARCLGFNGRLRAQRLESFTFGDYTGLPFGFA